MTNVSMIRAGCVAAALWGWAGAASGQPLYAADNLTTGTLSGVVAIDGATVSRTGSFLTSGTITGLATDGTSVYASLPDGISKYDTTGGLEGSYANLGIDGFADLAVAKGALYAADNLTTGTLSGVVVLDAASLTRTGSFLTTGKIAGLATNGTDLFASLPDGIAEYALDGTFLQSYQNLGIDGFGALSYADGVLYAADNLTTGTMSGVVLLDGSLTRLGSFLTDGYIAGLASDGSAVYASLPDGITKYDTSGTNTGNYANLGIDQFGPLALAPGAVPEPALWAMLAIGFGAVGGTMRKRADQQRWSSHSPLAET